MTTGRHTWTDDEVAEIDRLRSKDVAWDDIAKHFGKSRQSVQQAFYKANRRGFSPSHDMTHKVPEGYLVKGVSTLYGGDGEVKAQWVKSNADEQARIEAMKEGLRAFVEDLPKLPKVPLAAPVQVKSRLASYVFGDPHFGMRAWSEETGENFDLKIAEAIHRRAIERLADSTPPAQAGLLTLLGDNFHYDGQTPVTPRSRHMLDADGRYVQMIRTVMRTLRHMIEVLLRKHRTLRVIVVGGNHDPALSPFLAMALDQIYENNERISFDLSPGVFHYFRFGKVLIGAHHGHTTKPDKLPSVMAADKAQDWGECEHRHWYVGHLHHNYSKEHPGVIVEGFNTLAARDAYATEGGWRSKRAAKAIIYDKEAGEVQRHIYFAPKVEARR